MSTSRVIEIKSIARVELTEEKLNPKAKLLFCYQVTLLVDNDEHVFRGYCFDRPQVGSDTEYGVVCLSFQDVPKGNLKVIKHFVDVTSRGTLSKVLSEVMDMLYKEEPKSFPILISNI